MFLSKFLKFLWLIKFGAKIVIISILPTTFKRIFFVKKRLGLEAEKITF